MLFPGLALLLTVLAFNLVGDGLQDALDPAGGERRARRSIAVTTTKGRSPCLGPSGGPCWHSPPWSPARLRGVRRRRRRERRAPAARRRRATRAAAARRHRAALRRYRRRQHRRPRGGQEGRQAHRPLRRRRRLHGPRQDVLHVRDRDHQRDPSRPVRVPAGGHDEAGAGPRRGQAGDLRGRQDRHGQAQAGRHVLHAGEPRGDLKDVKYAIERAFTANVANGYAGVYFGDLKGAPEGAGRLQGDPGHRDAGRPDDRLQPHQGHGRGARRRARDADLGPGAEGVRARSTTRRTRRPTARATRSTPARTWSSPTPRARRPATCPARRIKLVRNPDYAAVDDFRPAYLDEIEFQAGNEDTAVATRRILSGESLASGDIEPPAEPAQAAAGVQQDRSSRPSRAAAGA